MELYVLVTYIRCEKMAKSLVYRIKLLILFASFISTIVSTEAKVCYPKCILCDLQILTTSYKRFRHEDTYSHLRDALRTYSWNCRYFSLSLRLSGDVETNLGPTRSSRKLKTKKLTVIHLNTRSLLRHFDELQYFVSVNCPEILCLSETWLDPSINDSEVYLRGYSLFRQDRNRSGGGVACYISDTLSSTLISCGTTNAGLEFLWVGVDGTLLPSQLLVGCFYRPPSSPVQSVHDICSTIDNILISSKYFIACGDFNVDFSDSNNHLSKILHDFVHSRLVSQPICHPTRVSESTNSILNLFLISPDVPYTQATVLDHAITDHYPISLLSLLPKLSPATHLKTLMPPSS